MRVTITHNSKEAIKRMNRKPKELARAMQRALRKSGLIVERFSKVHAPVDTGRLRASINTTLGDMTATVRPNVKYAIYVHDGTRYMRGRPFMKQGFEDAESDIRAVFNREIDKVL